MIRFALLYRAFFISITRIMMYSTTTFMKGVLPLDRPFDTRFGSNTLREYKKIRDKPNPLFNN